MFEANEEGKVLTELVRLDERCIDKQLELLAATDARTDKSIDLGTALIALAPTAWAFVVASNKAALTPPVLFLAAVSGLSILAGMIVLIASKFLGRGRRSLGPDPGWVKGQLSLSNLTLKDVQRSVIKAFPEVAEINSVELARSRTTRRTGVALVVAGAILFGCSFALLIPNVT